MAGDEAPSPLTNVEFGMYDEREVHWISYEDIANYDVMGPNKQVYFLSHPTTFEKAAAELVIQGDVALEQILYYTNDEARVWSDSDRFRYEAVHIWIDQLPIGTTLIFRDISDTDDDGDDYDDI